MTMMTCDGNATCLKDCVCKQSHDIHKVTGPGCIDAGSCYHNEHSDGKFRECGHILTDNMCDGKDGYNRTELADIMWRSKNSVRYYRCTVCGLFHLKGDISDVR